MSQHTIPISIYCFQILEFVDLQQTIPHPIWNVEDVHEIRIRRIHVTIGLYDLSEDFSGELVRHWRKFFCAHAFVQYMQSYSQTCSRIFTSTDALTLYKRCLVAPRCECAIFLGTKSIFPVSSATVSSGGSSGDATIYDAVQEGVTTKSVVTVDAAHDLSGSE